MSKTKEEIIKEYEHFDNVGEGSTGVVEIDEYTFEELVGEEYFN